MVPPNTLWENLLRVDEDLEALSIGHVLVSGRDTVDVGGGVEHLSRFDRSVDDVGHQFFDVGPSRCRSAGQADVAAEQAGEADRCLLVLRDADATDDSSGAYDANGLFV